MLVSTNQNTDNIDPVWILRYGPLTLFIISFFAYKILNRRAIIPNLVNKKSDDDNDVVWEQAFNEAEGENRKKALWARVLVMTEGNESIAKAKYIELRVPQIANEYVADLEAKSSTQESRLKAELDARESKCQDKLELLGYKFNAGSNRWKITEYYGEETYFDSIEKLEEFVSSAPPTHK
jgi:hypothetical protein